MRTFTKRVSWVICLLMLAMPVGALANTFEGNADDVDGDGVPNRADLDADNDGILDAIECNTAPACPDTDGDGVPDNLDIDSDGDGITDAYEAFGTDADGDGRYDGFDDQDRDGADDGIVTAGTLPFDSDGDGFPDHLDDDSDNDGLLDSVEGHDSDGDGAADNTPIGIDVDLDGLDDAFDAHCMRVDLCRNGTMLGGKQAPVPDLDGDGVDDFRQPPVDADAGPDAGGDAGGDAGTDAGTDAGIDAGTDAGSDAGPGSMDAGDDGGVADSDSGFNEPDASDPGGIDAQNAFENELYVDGGGCSSAPNNEPSPIWFALLLAIGVLRRRRRQT